jgi:predicted 2-oxoglutarate/Fe(II)-dependent dioxygenase YbiX
MNSTMSYNLKDYVYKINDFLDQSSCKSIIKKVKKFNWQKHEYYSNLDNTKISYENDLSVLSGVDIPEIITLNKKLDYALKLYLNRLNFSWYTYYTGYSWTRINRYDKNTLMRLHCDHIHSLFDGNNKGVPVLTILGALNDEYKGGELIMFDKEVIELKAGNLVIFPSNFLFPHEVKPIISGTRYSYVSWCW